MISRKLGEWNVGLVWDVGMFDKSIEGTLSLVMISEMEENWEEILIL